MTQKKLKIFFDKNFEILKKKIRSFGLRNEFNFFIENLSSLLSAGMGVSFALSSIKEELSSRRMISVVKELEEGINEGSSLSKALTKARILSPHTLALIELGEISGRLTENLKVAVLQNEKEQLFRSRLRSSLMYAFIIFTLAIVVGVGTAWFTLPQLASFYKELDTELPLITRIIIFVGEFLRDYGYIFITLFVTCVLIAVYFLFSFPKTKFIGHSILFRTPVIKKLIKEVEISNFGFLLGTMLGAGMPISQSLDSLPGTTTFLNYKRFYRHLQQRVYEGNSIQKSFSSYPKAKKLFPASVRQMIKASEQSGNLSETLIRVGKMYESKVETTAKNLPTILEPIVLVFIGFMVAILAFGTILPIYNLSDVL